MTPKQERFVAEYLVDSNATQAAIRAGYSERTARSIGSELLTNPNVSAKIQDSRQEMTEKLDIGREFVLRGLKKNFERAMQEEPVVDKEGNETGVYRYEGSVANKALELLGKNAGMFSEKVEVTGKDGAPIIVQFVREGKKRTAG